jgi:hypothetical protein
MRPVTLAAFSLLVLGACRNDPDKPDTDTIPIEDTAAEPVDADGDGFTSDDDCDDGDPEIHPGADETCDGLDNDCDGDIDEEAVDATMWHIDGDEDGYGDPDLPIRACEAPDGYVEDGSDCDDGEPETHPEAPERCDGEDNDCDGEIDEDLNEVWYADADGDGFGNAANELASCDPGEGWVADATDCDDTDSTVFPGTEEVCNDADDDCDGQLDEGLESSWYADDDGDGFGAIDTEILDCEPGAGWVENAEDCDDANSAIHPDATEVCDTLDNDCDGLVDDQDDTVEGATTWYTDADDDGFGDETSSVEACEQPSGTAAYGGDCDDADPAYNPSAVEADCTDPADYNCDGSTGYADDDSDGWAACEDCDDSDAAVNPDADELCNNVDDDCDGTIDEDDATDAATWYTDTDGDGYGDSASTTLACDQPSGTVAAAYATDCDDGDATVSPVAAERCDGVDNDCDGLVDDDDSAVSGTSTWYQDYDGDGFGDASAPTSACSQPSDHVADSTDCDDDNNTVYPGAVEICDGLDGDCDGTVDEGVMITWYADADGDGYGDAGASSEACSRPGGYVSSDTDCDDGDAAVSPGSTELCNGVDDDCDGRVDEDDAADADRWYIDADGDGYGSSSYTTNACSQPSGYVADSTDCDDFDGDVHPSATEICDGVDDDCDGLVDDDDGSVTGLSTWYLDADADGWGDAGSSLDACEAPSGYAADSGDCDDGDDAIHPDAAEVCDGVDNDCDGYTDTGTVDTDGDGLCNDIDPDVYSYDFDDGAWTGWSYVDLGGSNVPNWSMSSGTLSERSNAARSIAYGPDLGAMSSYTVTVDLSFGGSANNAAGIVFAMVDSDDYWMATWDDPNDYYGSYSPASEVALVHCELGVCTTFASDDDSSSLSVSTGVWSELSVTVDGDDVYIDLDGVEVVSYAGSGLDPLGADIVGLYTWDNDGGVYYDNFEVTNP